MGVKVFCMHDADASREAKKFTFMEIKNKKQWKSLFDSIKETNELLVIDFTAAWCGPCKTMQPKVKELAAKYTEVVFAKIDVDKIFDVAMAFQANVLPAFVFVKSGKEIDRVVGAKYDELLNKIEKHRI